MDKALTESRESKLWNLLILFGVVFTFFIPAIIATIILKHFFSQDGWFFITRWAISIDIMFWTFAFISAAIQAKVDPRDRIPGFGFFFFTVIIPAGFTIIVVWGFFKIF